MAKNQINFSKMSKEAMAQLTTFKEAAIALAQEDLRFKAELKPLKKELETIIENRENDLAQGMSVEDVDKKFSRLEVDMKIRKAQVEHEKIIEPLNNAIKDTYAFIPDTMYLAYDKKITEHKRGDFLNAITEFLNNLGIEDCKQGQINKLAENMSDMFGARYATSKKIVENNTFHTAISKAQFNKLFMAVFCDMYIK